MLSSEEYPCRDVLKYIITKQDLDSDGYSGVHYRVIGACPKEQNFSLVQSCIFPQKLEDFIPVSGRTTGRVYGNRHCAMCNGETEVDLWTLYVVECNEYQPKTFKTFQESDEYILENCMLNAIPPRFDTASRLNCGHTTNLYISSCNQTGMWEDYSRQLVNDCIGTSNRGSSVMYWVGSKMMIFANVFCFLCNMPDGTLSSGLCDAGIVGSIFGESKQQLMNLISYVAPEERVYTFDGKCKSYEIYDPLAVRFLFLTHLFFCDHRLSVVLRP